jgi:hypothetical protein
MEAVTFSPSKKEFDFQSKEVEGKFWLTELDVVYYYNFFMAVYHNGM